MSPTLKEPETDAEWRCAHAAEATACDLLRAERASLRAERDAALARAELAERRLRITAALIIAAIGSVGPEDAEDAARRLGDVAVERDAALADVTAWRGFAGSVAVAVHPGDAGAVIANHLAGEDLPDLLAAVERVVGERDAALARAVTAEAGEAAANTGLRSADILLSDGLDIVRSLSGGYDAWEEAVVDHLSPEPHTVEERLRAEVARLRAVIASAAADLPLRPEGAFLTPPEADAEAVRVALLAALRGGR